LPPTKTPTRKPVGTPTHSPTQVELRVPAPGCETAYIYCPGYSTCFLDDKFNSGRDTISHTPGESAWGWNIEYTCGGTLHCEIWTGAEDCNKQNGRKVGTFVFNEDFATYKLYSGYQSNEFNFYAGQCVGNDDGASVTNGRWCLPGNVAASARNPETYPLGTHGKIAPVSQFSYSNSNEARYMNADPWKDNNYDMFPLGRTGLHWLTANLEVCPCPD
jgi:hypothetical protein